MRLLVTTDLHLGRKLYDHSIIEDQKKFLDWLLDLIVEKNINVLLLCGDIFDSHIPSADAYETYYNFLNGIKRMGISAVMITGNHDPAKRLVAPKEFVKMANIHIIGGICESLQDYIVNLEVNDKRVSIVAIPHIEEGGNIKCISLEKDIEKNKRHMERVKRIYRGCVSLMDPENIRILIGHLSVQGGVFSDTERRQIGDVQIMDIKDFPFDVDCIFMGHLHRPQTISGKLPIMYPGSPMSLSFREVAYDKKVYILNIEKHGHYKIDEIVVPVFRKLVSIKGSLIEILKRAKNENWKDSYIDVKVLLDVPRIGIADEIRKAFRDNGGFVLKIGHELNEPSLRKYRSIDDIKTKSPVDIFCEYYKNKFRTDPDKDLLDTFKDLLYVYRLQDSEGK